MQISKNHIHRKVSKVEFLPNGNLLHSTKAQWRKNDLDLIFPFYCTFRTSFLRIFNVNFVQIIPYLQAWKFLEMKRPFNNKLIQCKK